MLLGIFAAAAVTLSAIRLFGVITYSVIQRTREMGVRMALGTRSVDVIGLVIRETAALTTIGVGVGLLVATIVMRSLRSFLFGVTPLDATTFIAACLMFVVVATLAAWVPARRATKVDPLVALRCE